MFRALALCLIGFGLCLPGCATGPIEGEPGGACIDGAFCVCGFPCVAGVCQEDPAIDCNMAAWLQVGEPDVSGSQGTSTDLDAAPSDAEHDGDASDDDGVSQPDTDAASLE